MAALGGDPGDGAGARVALFHRGERLQHRAHRLGGAGDDLTHRASTRIHSLGGQRAEQGGHVLGTGPHVGERVGSRSALLDQTVGVVGKGDQTARRDIHTERARQRTLQAVRLVDHDGIVLGKDAAAGCQVEPVQVVVGDDHVCRPGALERSLRETAMSGGATGRAGALHPGDRHLLPRRVRYLRVEVSPFPGGVIRGPSGDGGDRREVVVGKEGCVEGTVETVAESLDQLGHAHVALPALHDRPGQVALQVLGEEGEVDRCQLVLERLGGGRHHRPLPGDDGRHQIGEGLAGSRPGLHEQVMPVLEGVCDGPGHLLLTRPPLGSWLGGENAPEGGEGITGAGHSGSVGRRSAGGRRAMVRCRPRGRIRRRWGVRGEGLPRSARRWQPPPSRGTVRGRRTPGGTTAVVP